MSKIEIIFPEDNSALFELLIEGNITAEQLSLVAAKFRFMSNYAWNIQETERAMRIAEALEKKGGILKPKPEIITPK